MRRIIAILLPLALMLMFVPGAFAICDPFYGTDGDDVVFCEGDDGHDMDVGRGNDVVTILNGITSRVTSFGGVLRVIVMPGAQLGSANNIAIVMDGDGRIISLGDISAQNGIALWGNGSITHVGNIDAQRVGVLAVGNVDVSVVGDIHAERGGIDIRQATEYINVYHAGDITGDGFGILLVGSGSIVNIGDITLLDDAGPSGNGIQMNGDGLVMQLGDIVAFRGIISRGDVYMRGDITAAALGIAIGEGVIDYAGTINITRRDGIGIRGDDTATEARAQTVLIDGTIIAPTAITLNRGDDVVIISGDSVIQGAVLLGAGDDVFIIEPGAEIVGTIRAGETEEVNGDTLILGNEWVCQEDDDPRIAEINAAIAGVNPNNGTLTYQGQTYTISEFEQLVNGMGIYTCFPWMQDGRLNRFDHGAPVALYCTIGGGVSVWDIDGSGSGTFTYAVESNQIVQAFALATASGINQSLGSDAQGNTLYALSDGVSLQFMGPEISEPGKTYQFNFDYAVCPQE